MAQNRKNQGVAGWVGSALLAVFLCLLIGGAGVGYVWQKSQIDELGHEFKKREQRLKALQRNNDGLRHQLALLRSPRFLDQRARELNLGLFPAQPAQILRLPEPECWPPVDETSGRSATNALRAGL